VLHRAIIVKFLTIENVKPVEILRRLRGHFDEGTLSRTQCITGESHYKKAGYRLKT
jgi:hypothetical protein